MRIQIAGLDVSRWIILLFGILIIITVIKTIQKKAKTESTKILFLLPAFVWILSFIIFPILYSLHLSFYNWQGSGQKTFIGFLNYVNAFKDYKVLNSLGVTLKFFIVSVTTEVGLGLLLAVLVQDIERGNKVFRILFLLPLFAPPVAIGFLAFIFFYVQGPVNQLLYFLFKINPVGWTSNPKVALFTIMILDIWEWTPFCFIILLAGLQLIPDEIKEAAYLDTNSSFRVFWRVAFPFLKPSLITVIMLRSIEALKIFDVPFSLTYGGPGFATETYSINAYKTALKDFSLGYGSALSFIFLIAVLIIFNLLFKYSGFTDIYD